jgi:hypothetical protein
VANVGGGRESSLSFHETTRTLCAEITGANLSDSPEDLVTYYRALEQGYDCAFGTRFGHAGGTHDYP